MNKILHVAVDVDDKAFHGYALGCDEAEGTEFISKPSAAHLTQALRKIEKPGYKTTICYEAGYLGYSLYRALVKAGLACEIIAPSLTPKPSGAMVKTDRIDARMLAQYYKKGLLVPIHIPDEGQEPGQLSVARCRLNHQADQVSRAARFAASVHGALCAGSLPLIWVRPVRSG